jgi:hypothetical protein
MKKLLGILFIIFFTNYLYSAEPVSELENFPTLTEFQTYEDSEAWFYSKVLEYYKISILYSAQIKSYGATPSSELINPTIDDLESIEFKILRKYYDIAAKLKAQIIELPSSNNTIKIRELQSKIKELESKNEALNDSLFSYSIDANKTDFYKVKYISLTRKLDSLQKSYIELNYNKNIENINALYPKEATNKVKSAILSLSISGQKSFYQDSKIDEKLNPGFGLVFHPGTAFGFGKIFEVYAEYSKAYFEINDARKIDINGDCEKIALGLNALISLDPIIRSEDFSTVFKLGIGYFHSNYEIENSQLGDYTNYGENVRFELAFKNFNAKFPFEIFGTFNMNKFEKDIYLSNSRDFKIDRQWINEFFLGVRLPLWTE